MLLQIDRLSKTYPNGVRALHQVSLTIGTGMFGLLGPNGAGKSTLMRTIATLQLPDSGSIRSATSTCSPSRMKCGRVLGYLPQEFGLYPNLSAEVTLDHFATLKGVTATGERRDLVASLLHQTNLWDARKKHVGTFSGGMHQRLGIAIALAGKPKLLIVDEPTAGLDPTERHRFLNLLGEIGQDIVVILSTHIVEDVRELCNAMAIINRGEVVLAGDPTRSSTALRASSGRSRCRKRSCRRTRRSTGDRVGAAAGRPRRSCTSTARPIRVTASRRSSRISRTCTSARSAAAAGRGGLIMFWTIYSSSCEYHLRRPVTYLYVFVFLLIAFSSPAPMSSRWSAPTRR